MMDILLCYSQVNNLARLNKPNKFIKSLVLRKDLSNHKTGCSSNNKFKVLVIKVLSKKKLLDVKVLEIVAS